MRQANAKAKEIIKKSESLRLTAYDDLQPKRQSFKSVADVKGVPTIGYGNISSVSKSDVVDRTTITPERAEYLFDQDINAEIRKLYNSKVLSPLDIESLNENQWAALVSFIFNLGVNKDWKLWKIIRAKQYSAVPAELARFVYSGGRVLPGLVTRRAEEGKIWLTPVNPLEQPVTPSSGSLRASDTPPAPQAVKPLLSSNSFRLGAVSTLASGTAAINGLIEQLNPLAMVSSRVGQWIVWLTVLAALIGIAMMVLKWWEKNHGKKN